MSQETIPAGSQAVMPYLMLHSAADFIRFTQEAYGAAMNGDIHYQPDGKGIMHAEVIVNGSVIMCCDTREMWQPTPANMFVYVADADESYAKALAAGAKSIMGLSDQSYGRSCGVEDPQGNVWWITSINKQ